jgi:acyl-coenzyme A synthetase/AMP-(fatty) acid ligase
MVLDCVFSFSAVVLNDRSKEGPKMAEAITKWVAGQVASHKRLRGGIQFKAEIPKR